MKKIVLGLVSIAIMLSSFNAVSYAEDLVAKIYVATNGSDYKDGTSMTSALASPSKAAMIAQAYASSGKAVEIIFMGGVYQLNDTLTLTSAHSGASAEAPIIYKAYGNEEVKFTVGSKIDAKRFSKTKNENINPDAKGFVYEADLLSFNNIAGGIGDTLVVNGEMQTISRYPNEGKVTLVGATGTNEAGAATKFVKVPDDRIGVWDGHTDMVYGYNPNQYTYSVAKFPSVTDDKIAFTDGANKTVTVMNSLYEVDSPGEYYIDTSSATLYYYPENDISKSEIYLSTGTKNIIEINGAKNIKFENIDLFCGNKYGFYIENSDNITIYGANISAMASGIYATNSTNMLICCNEICDMKESAVYVSGGEQVTLTPSFNIVRNNKIHDYAKIYEASSQGIGLGGVGITVAHNEIYNAPHMGIYFKGNDHIIEYNRIYNVQKSTWDCGAIYTGRSWTDIGTVIRNNYIYHTKDVIDYTYYNPGYEYASGTDADAIYLDDIQCGITVTGNIIYNYSRGIIFGGGSNNVCTDNIVIDSRRGINYDKQGAGGWRSQHLNPHVRYQRLIYQTVLNLFNNAKYDEEQWFEHYKYMNLEDTFNRVKEYRDLSENHSYENIATAYTKTADECGCWSAVCKLGGVYNRTIDNNYYTGEYAMRYKNKQSMYTYLWVACSTDDSDEGNNPSILLTDKEADITVSDDYEIEIKGTAISGNVSRSTAEMGIVEDSYKPSK